jgi:hypothetical protein
MTSEQDFDRIARAWLDVGPSEAPDRTIAAALQAVESMPQERRRPAWPVWRPITVNRLVMLAATGGLVAITLGALALTAGSPGPIAPPTASPSASPSAEAGALVPDALASRWMGSERPISGFIAATGTSIIFGPDTFAFSRSNQNQSQYFQSAASVADDGRIQLESAANAAGGCAEGDVGVYSWTLSPAGRTLTIRAVRDDCSTRLGAVPGTWWKMACKNSSDNCLGELETGTYASQFITPRAHPGDPWSPDFAAITYTVPEGWANSADWPTVFTLTPAQDYALETATGPEPDAFHAIYLHPHPAATTQTRDCSEGAVVDGPRTVDDLVAWVRSLSALSVTEPMPIVIDDHPGQMIDVSLEPGQGSTCPDASAPFVDFLAYAGGATDGWVWGIQEGERQRIIFLDLGVGDVVMVAIDSTHPDRYDELVSQAMPIIESLRFD